MKQNRKDHKPTRRDLHAIIHKKPTVFAVYLILRIIVLLTLVSSILRGEYENAFVCLLVLVLFMLPFFIQQNFGIELPNTLEIIILLFIFASEIKALFEFPGVDKKVDEQGISELFGIGPAHTPGTTVFKNIYELKPASFAIFNKSGFTCKKYWKLKSEPHKDSLRSYLRKSRIPIK